MCPEVLVGACQWLTFFILIGGSAAIVVWFIRLGWKTYQNYKNKDVHLIDELGD
jgi:hypothetical protein